MNKLQHAAIDKRKSLNHPFGWVLAVLFLLLIVNPGVCLAKSGNSDFIIQNGVLVNYKGNKKKVVVPKSVKRIAGGAFEDGNGYRKNKIREIIVPGTVKRIDSEAFAFCTAKKIVLKNGVKRLGSRVFMDSYVKQLYLPKSITKAGKQLLETEEGLRGTKIYVKKNSYIHKKIKKQNPYGEYRFVWQ